MTENTSIEASPIVFTNNAANKARQLMASKALNAPTDDAVALRVFIQGGGCSGFQYSFDLEENVESDDFVVDNEGVRLVVDPMSFQYLLGAEIDYKEDLMGAQFVVTNPNASSTCGCGMSFSV
ncbi:MAG: iron-sulfur cluster insertion protein [Gammaproteobacteria bacterium]|jgi:iron-sulfur cluster insertion protein